MSIWRSVFGEICLELVSAVPEQLITVISNSGIPLYQMKQTGELSFQVLIQRTDFIRLRELVLKHGASMKIISTKGVYWLVAGMRKRPILLVGIFLFVLLVMFLPTRILFVQVDGNRTVSTETILNEVLSCGVGFGSVKRDIRSERVKNTLLESIPQLQWVGVNTRGCVAVISVKEREADKKVPSSNSVSSVVASHDGIIKEMTVIRGNPICQVGQVVKKGEMLVSGYTDCGLTVKAEAAEAEIFADTLRNTVTVTPLKCVKRTSDSAVSKKFSLLFGKKLINLFKDSGISCTSCVKMITKYVLTLPGGYQLPVALICCTETTRDLAEYSVADESELNWVEGYTSDYLRGQMLAGQIHSSRQTVQLTDSLFIRHGQYTCTEMIGQTHTEGNIQDDGKRD